jgi:hypothetical protein
MTEIASRASAIAFTRDQNPFARDQKSLDRERKRFAIQVSEVKMARIVLASLKW